MTIVDESVLARFRGRWCCEVCRVHNRVFPHHYHARGMGGGSRIDHPYNLLSVCNACHDKIHWGKVARADVLAAIARREGKTPQQIQEWLWETLSRGKE